MNILHIALSMRKSASDRLRISFLHKVANNKPNPLMWLLEGMMNPTPATPPDPKAPNPYSWDNLAKTYAGYQPSSNGQPKNPYSQYKDKYKMSDPRWSASANQTADVIHRRVPALKKPMPQQITPSTQGGK